MDSPLPPTSSNVSYRGVVLAGQVHNDDPDAENQWMPAGSFWTQPKGGVHITSAQGQYNLAYIEIEDGPYLVQPTEEAFHSGEVPINVDPTNLVWLPAGDIQWMTPDHLPAGCEVAFLWGEPQTNGRHGTFLRLPAGFSGHLLAQDDCRAVVVQGALQRPSHTSKPTRVHGTGKFGPRPCRFRPPPIDPRTDGAVSAHQGLYEVRAGK